MGARLKTITVSALQSFEWKGQPVYAGQALTVTPIEAVVLAQKHQVSLARRTKVIAPPPEPEPVAPPKSRGRYRRRDLQAEETTALAPLGENALVTVHVPDDPTKPITYTPVNLDQD